jgi:dTDP-4-dehydrorhamnose reductase
MCCMITGSQGMLGRCLMHRLADRHPIGVDLSDCDLRDAAACQQLVSTKQPTVVIHCAAFTAVDRCESEPDAAFAANAVASANLAVACHRQGSRLIAISTDYVFDGTNQQPYHEWDPAAPRTVYGQSKWAGEEAIRQHCPDHSILRIAWLYGAGGPSFLHSMLALGAENGPPLRVVNDQIGNPTSCDAVADLIQHLLDKPLPGVIHASCSGEATWFEFAQEIFRLRGLPRAITACSSDAFPRPATRPANSRLEKRVLRLAGRPNMPDWRESLQRFFREYPEA